MVKLKIYNLFFNFFSKRKEANSDVKQIIHKKIITMNITSIYIKKIKNFL